MSNLLATYIIGGSGYVSGELVRLTLGHPELKLMGVVSSTKQSQAIETSFPHLKPILTGLSFIDLDNLLNSLESHSEVIILSAAPHGKSTDIVNKIYSKAKQLAIDISIIDTSADFRFRDPKAYEAIYGIEHAAPALLDEFICSIPEIKTSNKTPLIAHPGCFATSMLLSIAPLLSNEFNIENVSISSVTGSSGSGALPQTSTHHPIRTNNHYAYNPLTHRHQPEVIHILEHITGKTINLDFVPQSGSFVRGIYSTAFIKIEKIINQNNLQEAFINYYKDSPFISIIDQPPKLKNICGTNYAELFVTVSKNTVVVNSAIDNLIKGAAGGAIQWVNKIHNFHPLTGLSQPSIGWY